MALTKATYALIDGAPANVKDFGAVGDGVANDRAAIQAAFNSGAKKVYFPSGVYWLGQYSTSEIIIDLSSLGSNISVLTDKSVELRCQTTASVIPKFFYLLNNSHFTCGPIKFTDTGYDPNVNFRGAFAFQLEALPGTGGWGDVVFDSIFCDGLVACVVLSGGDSSARVRGIHIKQLFSNNCYYGFNSQNQGDGVKIDNLIAFQNYRPYFVYGATGHKVKIFNRANRSTSGAVNISRSPGGLDTQGIEVSYVSRDNTATPINHVNINHIDLLGGTISGIKIDLDIESSAAYSPVNFINYSGSGGSPTSAASSNLVYDITLSGSCDAQATPVEITASYASKGILNFTSGKNFAFNSTIPTKFYLGDAKRNQAVTWTATTVAPAIGNGALTSNYDVVNGLCHYTISLTAGSTTTFGTGEWLFSLPIPSTGPAVGSVWALDSGTAYYIGACKVSAGSNLGCYTNNNGSSFSPTIPFSWAANDELLITLTYPIS
jgi:hypothetical protein